MRWFGVRSVYCSRCVDPEHAFSYEERVLVFLADSFESAIKLAEHESQQYVGTSESIALDYFNAFEIIDDQIQNGTEVYSLIRDSNLASEEYIDSYFDTGDERSGKWK